jgi:hypothetical protein
VAGYLRAHGAAASPPTTAWPCDSAVHAVFNYLKIHGW